MSKITITKEQYGIRLDKFLTRDFFSRSLTRGEIIRQIKNGNVLVNGKKIKPSYILREDDKLEINLEENSKGIVPNRKIKIEVIYKDENIIVINKPAGLQVHPDFHEKNNTLVNALIAKFPEIKSVGEDVTRPGIVHRLDKDTSGVIIIARNQKSFLELKKKFQNREIEKKYWAIVCRKSDKKQGVIDKPLARAMTYKKQIIAGKKTKTKIREAVTKYKVLKTWNNLSLLEVMPKTGRMHQIRVHMNSIGHPIVGDKLYKAKNIKTVDAPRQMLHAKSIGFELLGKKYSFEAEIPSDFKSFLTKSE